MKRGVCTMLSMDGIRAGVDDLVSAAILVDGWEESLVHFAVAAGARDAVLMRNEARKTVAVVVSPEAALGAADVLAGRAPPNSRYQRVGVRYSGFRIDQDDYAADELARDPYYQEFLRPKGVFWHANTILALGSDEYVELSLKRRVEFGPYEPPDRIMLNSVLPELHAFARIAKGVLDAEARGMSWQLGRRGGAIIELDSRGRVLPGQAAGEGNPACPLRILRHRLVTDDRAAQLSIDRAIASAISRPGRLGVAALTNLEGRRYLLQVHPVPGRARDVFASATALALLVERDRVLVADFKTARRPPASLAEVPLATLKQMGAYAAALGAIYPGRRVEAVLLYTQTPLLIALPAELLEAHKPGLMASQESLGG